MAGSLDFPFGSGAVSTPVSAGTLLKADATVDPGIGFSVANQVAGDLPVGEAMYDSNSNAIQAPNLSSNLVYEQPVKLWFPTYLALVTGGGLVTRGNSLYGITGGFLSVTNPGAGNVLAVSAETTSLTPGQLIQVYKVYVS